MRRAVALRGIAALGAAALGGCSPLVRAAERLHGCVDTKVPLASGMRVVRGVVPTRHVAGPVHYIMVVPESAHGLDAVAYLLPGRGGDAGAVLTIGMDGFLTEYLRGGGRPFAIAALDAGESYFHPRTSGEDRLTVATIDLPRIVRGLLGAQVLREAIMGQSMGGYGALLAAERDPLRYRAVAVAGPAIFPSYEDENHSVGDAFDSAADYARYDVLAHAAALRGRPVHIAVGRRDPFLPGVRRFARACPTAEVVEAAGCHDDGFWRTAAPAMLAFVGAHL
ncbi:MAG: esterase [Candidatus Eremiobacteraeota bacterium]|nr:esterase [Candidatus Eremiobacteraeota bacterium]